MSLAAPFAQPYSTDFDHTSSVVSDVPASFWEPTAWAWFDGRTQVSKTAALTGPGGSATVANTFFSAWFSVEGEGVVANDAIAGLFYARDELEGNAALSINRVSANLPYNRLSVKSGGASRFTTSTEYKNSGSPVNPARWFIAVFLDHVTPTNSVAAIFSGTAWTLITETMGNGYVMDFTQVLSIGVGSHGTVASSRWWGRIADAFLKNDITPIDLTVAATRNALLVDPTADGSGLGLGTPNIFFRNSAALFNAGTNAGNGGPFDLITDGLVANSPYTQARVVTTGTQAIQIATMAELDSPLTAFTFSAWFKNTATTQNTLLSLYNGAGGTFAVVKQASGNGNKLFASLADSDGTGLTVTDGPPPTPSNRTSFAVNTGALTHVYIVGSIASDLLYGYVNGTLAFAFRPVADAGMLNFGTQAGVRVGEGSTGSNRWVGSLGDVWFADSYLDPATHLSTFYNAGVPPLLTGRSHSVGGVTPLLLLGQGMGLTHWNAPRNLGSSAGTVTITGTFALE